MRESVLFYESRLDGLGLRFLAAVEKTTERISTCSEAGVPLVGEFRKRIVPGFPYNMGLLNIALQQPIKAPNEPRSVSGRECSKKHALSLSEGSIQQGRSHFDERSVLIVREHGKRARTPLAAFFNIPNIIYRVWSDYVYLVAVAHQYRRPGYWRERADHR
ncbi:MAG: hypothetical protein IH978_05465 [Nitrospinae bacterium]|nr:hypothetical protein [Nitrospinota bacterium]